ncbi:RHS repeat domain-containing protein [Eleftheria terrae]|uniref:RHS repeat domain-containing protein n=1 Tax=Eleftheria terrae TaxID=1597781 RepID=UPI00263B7F30|nr:hypothetical protein [Eleftheria terrae]WKB56138.1 hypothetical protein N7L95_29290 [Eleftheria terrae]
MNEANACIPYVDRYEPKPRECGVGNPIYPVSGGKSELLATGLHLGALPLQLRYDSSRRVPDVVSPAASRTGEKLDAAGFGELWFSSLHRRLTVQAGMKGATASRGDGRLISFQGDGGGNFTAQTGEPDRLMYIDGQYLLVDGSTGTLESYNAAGQLTELWTTSGEVLRFTYIGIGSALEEEVLAEVRDDGGRSIRFEHEPSAFGQRVVRVLSASTPLMTISYDAAGNVSTLTWGDSSAQTFLYERSDLPWALTGVVSENGKRRSTFGYDTYGRAISTERAGGTDRYSVSYVNPPAAYVTVTYDAVAKVLWRVHSWQAPLGTMITKPDMTTSAWGAAKIGNVPRITSRSQPAGAGCPASSSATAYDAQGNAVSRDDFNGKRVCYGYEPGRALEGVRVEGLAKTASCETLIKDSATLPATARKVSTRWHPDRRLETQVAEPRRLVTMVYNGQPDPFSNGALASCAPATAKLPDGKPIAVVCKRVEQATTDEDGSKGFAATLAPGVAARQWSYTYNEYGQVLSEDGPRTDVADVMKYEYYTDTTAEWTRGDLKQVTDAAGQVTRYTRYNPHGQVLTMVDPNNVSTEYSYDLRQRLKSVSTGGQSTKYDYEPTGLLKQVTQPDGSYVRYSYDDAHRLTGVSDGLGNSVTYTLNNAGEREKEEVKDPGGALMRNISRAYDALGRLQSVTGAVH